MKKILGLMIICMALFNACETELDSPYDNTNKEITFDPNMNLGYYEYSDLSDQIQVTFLVDSLTSSVEVTAFRVDSTILNTQTVTTNGGECIVTYKASDLGIHKIGDEARVKIVNSNTSKEAILTYASCWINPEKGNSTITPGVTFTPIETKATTDTVYFKANVPEWISTASATWTMKYKVGKAGTEHSVTPVLSADKDEALFVKSMKDLGVAGDTVIVTATITNNGITRSGEYEFIIKNISSALMSKTAVNPGFNPAVSNTQKDTVSLSATSIKNYRGWLNMKAATWDVLYTVGTSTTTYPVTVTPVNNDTMSVVSFSDVMGHLQGVAQYDTVKVKGVMNINGASYPVNYSFKVQK